MSHHNDEKPTVFADSKHLVFIKSVSNDELKEIFSEFISDLTQKLKKSGCKIIGHIKGKLDAGESGQIFFNVTTFEGEPRFQGELLETVSEAELVINIIVYGVTEKQVSGMYKEISIDLLQE